MRINIVPSLKRRVARGANLALIAIALTSLIGLMGIAIYTGVQAYVRNELQKAATTAALAGAAVYMKAGGVAQPNFATNTAKDVFDKVMKQTPALRSFNVRLKSVGTNASADTVTVSLTGEIPTPLLAPVKVEKIDVSADGSAKALRYMPTSVGAVVMAPPGVNDAFINLEFPLVDNPEAGSIEIVTHSGSGNGERGYIVFACTSDRNICYNIMEPGQGAIGTRFVKGRWVCYGTCQFDIGKAGVKKATSLRFVDDGIWNVMISGESQLDTRPSATVVSSVELYGYAGQCAGPTKCGIPRGFSSF